MSGRVASTRFVHSALFYRSDAEYLTMIGRFVTDGLALGQPVAVAVPGRRLRPLREALGTAARKVTLLDMAHEGRNPGRIIANVLRRFADRHRDQRVRIVGEPTWPGRSAVEYPACVQHEALINMAFVGRDVTILCPFDAEGLADAAVDDAHATHPVVMDGDGERASETYAPDDVLVRYNEPLPAPDVDTHVVATPEDVTLARRHTVAAGQRLGLARERVHDLALIVTELVTNSLLHSPGPGLLTVFRHGDHVVCEVRDPGRLDDPLAGRRPADPGHPHGRGLLLVNDLADLVRVYAGPGGTTIRALLRV